MNRKRQFFAIALLLCMLALLNRPVAAQEGKAQTKIHCPACGVQNPAIGKFCKACGIKLSQLKQFPESKVESPVEAFELVSTLPEQMLPPPDTLRAKAVFDSAFQKVDEGRFEAAALDFDRIIREFPASRYAESSAVLKQACEKMARLRAQMEKDAKQQESAGRQAFGGAFLGTTLGLLGLLVLVGLIAGL